jgi:site-specific DNA-methyltransferase (adenine-specific)
MGSGTTGVASKMLHRDFIGFEIDGKYFEIAEHRIDNKLTTTSDISVFEEDE